MYLTIQQQRINFNNVIKYYMKDNSLYIVSSTGNTIYYTYNSSTKVKKVIEWLDTKLEIINSLDLVIEE